jgi:hypothetical protein
MSINYELLILLGYDVKTKRTINTLLSLILAWQSANPLLPPAWRAPCVRPDSFLTGEKSKSGYRRAMPPPKQSPRLADLAGSPHPTAATNGRPGEAAVIGPAGRIEASMSIPNRRLPGTPRLRGGAPDLANGGAAVPADRKKTSPPGLASALASADGGMRFILGHDIPRRAGVGLGLEDGYHPVGTADTPVTKIGDGASSFRPGPAARSDARKHAGARGSWRGGKGPGGAAGAWDEFGRKNLGDKRREGADRGWVPNDYGTRFRRRIGKTVCPSFPGGGAAQSQKCGPRQKTTSTIDGPMTFAEIVFLLS